MFARVPGLPTHSHQNRSSGSREIWDRSAGINTGQCWDGDTSIDPFSSTELGLTQHHFYGASAGRENRIKHLYCSSFLFYWRIFMWNGDCWGQIICGEQCPGKSGLGHVKTLQSFSCGCSSSTYLFNHGNNHKSILELVIQGDLCPFSCLNLNKACGCAETFSALISSGSWDCPDLTRKERFCHQCWQELNLGCGLAWICCENQNSQSLYFSR